MYWHFLLLIIHVFKKYNILNNQNVDLDDRVVFYPEKIKYDNTTIEKIIHINEITEKINLLESTNLSIDDKLYEFEKINIPKIYNIFNGGLFNDWEFDFL